MPKIRFSFLESKYDKISLIPYQSFVAESGAKIFNLEQEKGHLSLCCFPTDKRYESVKGVKVNGYETKHIDHRDENGELIHDDAKESIDIEMPYNEWNAIKKMADSCGFNYEILG